MMPMALPSVWIALPLSLILPLTVYNFEVNDLHNYYVGTQEVLVHNECIKMKILRDQSATLGIPEPNITQFVESLDNPVVFEQVVMMQIAQMWISVRGVQI
jgi:hypothetical protein